MDEFIRVATSRDVAPGTCTTVDVNGTPVALFNVDGTYYAISDTCLHMHGPLAEGDLEGCVVTCPWHGWQYDVTSGACKTNPMVSVQTFEVKVEGDDVLVKKC